MNPDRVAGVRRYFTETPLPPQVASLGGPKAQFIIGGALCFLGFATFAASSELGVFGVLFLLAGMAVGIPGASEYNKRIKRNRDNDRHYHDAWHSAEPKPNDVQMDIWFDHSIKAIKARGFEALHLTPEALTGAAPDGGGREPLIVCGVPTRPDVRMARGMDNELRFDAYHIAIIFLARWKLCSFQCELDMATGAFYNEATREFHYQHINTLRTQNDRFSLNFQQQNVNVPPGWQNWLRDRTGNTVFVTTRQMFEIGVAGDSITVVVGVSPDERFGGADPALRRMKSQADNALGEIRTQLQWYNTRGRGGIGSLDEPDLGF